MTQDNFYHTILGLILGGLTLFAFHLSPFFGGWDRIFDLENHYNHASEWMLPSLFIALTLSIINLAV